MDSNPAPVPDQDAEAPELTQSDWLADLDRYYQDDYPEPRRPDEFTVLEWRNEMVRRRSAPLHRNQAAVELEKLMEQGRVTRRRSIEGGRQVWLYSFVKPG